MISRIQKASFKDSRENTDKFELLKEKKKKKKFSLGNCYIYIPTIYIYTYKRIL